MFYIPSLLDSLKVGSLELRNRIVMPPMAFGLSNEKGEVTDRLIDHYVQRSENLGLLIVEATNVSPEGRIFNRQLNITSDESIPGFKRLVTGIHDYGTPVALQLLHGGGASTTELSGVKPIAP